ncbi:MAG TPA: signal peptide peptidase SppA [Clostridiales bacterium]|nr:signal peptide peptidase SppA [Clostridiales bacterium]HQP70600.1 signal peptide peptidase SppA [Clostridiales bacterium]
METIKNAIKWFFKTVFTVIIVFAVLFFFLAAFIAKLSYENIKKDDILNGSYLVLSFPEGIIESPTEKIDLMNLEKIELNRKSLTLYDVLKRVEDASDDPLIKGIILDLDNWNAGAEHTNEIAVALNEFKGSSKLITAAGSSLDKSSYMAALSSDEILLDPSNSCNIMLNGFSASVPYLKDLGDKLGVSVNVIHIGQYKGAGENFARNTMSDQFRESILKLLNDRHDLLTGTISERRSLEKSAVSGMIEKGEAVFITPQQALELKLVDKLMSWDEMIKDKHIKKKQLVDIRDYIGKEDQKEGKKIAVIFAEGDIVDSDKGGDFTEDNINPDKFEKILEKIRKDSDVKAIVLRVNSPGGSALASEKILRKIIEIKKTVPVTVSMGPVAASGGYYISCQADKIFADPYTVTGSIGVVSMLPNVKKLYDKIGIKTERISMGKYSDIFDFTKEQSEEDVLLMKSSMEKIYAEFKSRVSDGRKISEEELEKIAQGQIWTGRQAKENGLVDELGGLDHAIADAAKTAGMKNYQLLTYPENKTVYEKIFSADIEEKDALTILEGSGLLKDEIEMLKRSVLFGNRPALLLPLSVK